jgi:hypothetical protein
MQGYKRPGTRQTKAMDDEAPNITAPATRPAYNSRAWLPGQSNGRQCSQNSRFCYGCTTVRRQGEEEDDDEEEEDIDWPGKIKDSITTLLAEKVELPEIVTSIYKVYETHIKDDVIWTHPVTGVVIEGPEWTKESIHAHILYGVSWSEPGEQYVDNIFASIVDRLNDSMVAEDDTIVEESRVAFCDTMKTLIQWKKYRKGGAGKSRQS